MTARRAGLGAVALTVLVVALLLVLVMFAARSGPQRIFAGPLRDPSIRAVNPTYHPPNPPALPGGHHRDGLLHSNPVFRAVGVALEALAALCVLWLLQRGVRRLVERLREVRRRPRRAGPPPVDDFEVLDDPDRLAEQIRRGAQEQFELLLAGRPRNAIVACWDRFEEYAERVHAARRPWETSSEFILRLLDAVAADDAAVTRLEGLYREARFSTHDIDESCRQAAVEALRAVHASLGAPVGTP